MASDGDSFLPRIQSVFYATFDLKHGPKIVYQVPEGLIATPTNVPPTSASGSNLAVSNGALSPASASSSSVTFHDIEPPVLGKDSTSNSRASSFSLTSPTAERHPSLSLSGATRSPNKRSTSQSSVLFNFDDISKYVIPPSALCGRLVICATRDHRIIGFPVALRGKYERNYFRYNLCFVFDRTADLSCYEPVVRKVSRVLTSCEEESSFLSSPETSPGLYAVLEQLYEDLNSYAETSISLDRFNSIELKIFPFYPNPPQVNDWMVPVALINLSNRVEPNWDLTIAKVCQYIDGVNHVRRIAHLADCDVHLARQAIAHLLYYQVIMTIDIFQYSNIYTFRKSAQWLADEKHVEDECGLYVTKPDYPVPDWPKLLHLYSRLKDGRTVLEWIQEHKTDELGIDARRFTSFGVIKGFLRRVHRFPVFLPETDTPFSSEPKSILNPSISRRRGRSIVSSGPQSPNSEISTQPTSDPSRARAGSAATTRVPTSPPVLVSTTAVSNAYEVQVQAALSATLAARPGRRASAAERSLEQFVPVGQAPLSPHLMRHPRSRASSGAQMPLGTVGAGAMSGVGPVHELGRRHSMITQPLNQFGEGVSPLAMAPAARAQQTRSPTLSQAQSVTSSGTIGHGAYRAERDPGFPEPPPGLKDLLDGEHHTDELSTHFEVGWPVLRRWLAQLGGGKDENDFGRVCIIHR